MQVEEVISASYFYFYFKNDFISNSYVKVMGGYTPSLLQF